MVLRSTIFTIYNHGHNILRILGILTNFLLQVKRSVIISNNDGSYMPIAS